MATAISPEQAAQDAKDLGLQPEPKPLADERDQAVEHLLTPEEAKAVYQKEIAPNIPKPDKPGAWGDIYRGFDELAKTGGGIVSLLGDITNSDATMEAGDHIFQKYKFQSELHPAQVGSFTNIGGVGDALTYAREAILGNAAMFIPGLVTGGIGSSIGEKLAGELVENLAAKVGEEEAAKMVAKRMIIGRMFKSAEELATKKGIASAGQEIGASAGAAASMVPIEQGTIYGETYDETGQRIPGYALAAGIPAGLLDAYSGGQLLQSVLGRHAAEKVVTGLWKRYGEEPVKDILKEGSTEFMQQIIEESGKVYANGEPIDKLFNDERFTTYLDAAFQGALGAVPFGAGHIAHTFLSPHPNQVVNIRQDTLNNLANEQLPPDLQTTAETVQVDPLAKRSEEIHTQIEELDKQIIQQPDNQDLKTQRETLVNEKQTVDDSLEQTVVTGQGQVTPPTETPVATKNLTSEDKTTNEELRQKEQADRQAIESNPDLTDEQKTAALDQIDERTRKRIEQYGIQPTVAPEVQELHDLRQERDKRAAELQAEINPDNKTVLQNRINEIDAQIEQLTTLQPNEKVTAKKPSTTEPTLPTGNEPGKPAAKVDGNGEQNKGQASDNVEAGTPLLKTGKETKEVKAKRKEVAAITSALVDENDKSPEAQKYVDLHRRILEPFLGFLAKNGIELRVGPKTGGNRYYSANVKNNGRIVLQLPHKEVFDSRNKQALEGNGRFHDEATQAKIIEEEVIHGAVFKVLQNQWEKTNKKKDFNEYVRTKMESYGEAIRIAYPNLPEELVSVYGEAPKAKTAEAQQTEDDIQLGNEFLRTVIQRVRTGQATEDFAALRNMQRTGIKTKLYDAFMDAVRKIYASVAQFVSDPKAPKIVKEIYDNANALLGEFDASRKEDNAKAVTAAREKKKKNFIPTTGETNGTNKTEVKPKKKTEVTPNETSESTSKTSNVAPEHQGSVRPEPEPEANYHNAISARAAEIAQRSEPGTKLAAITEHIESTHPALARHIDNIIAEGKPDATSALRLQDQPIPIRGEDTRTRLLDDPHAIYTPYSIELTKQLAKDRGIEIFSAGEEAPNKYIIDTTGDFVANPLANEINEDASVHWPATITNKLEEAKAARGIPETEALNDLGHDTINHSVVGDLDARFGHNDWIMKSFAQSAGRSQGVGFPEAIKSILNADPNYFDGLDVSQTMIQKMHPTVDVGDRAGNVKIRAKQELRVHVLTDRDGNPHVIPFSTFWKLSADEANADNVAHQTPITNETDDIQAAHDHALSSIQSLPRSDRSGQLYGLDVVKLRDGGWGIVELNPADWNGQSGFMFGNPLAHEAYMAALFGDRPVHAELASVIHQAIEDDGGEVTAHASQATPEMQLEWGHAEDFLDNVFRYTAIEGQPREMEANPRTNYWGRSKAEQVYTSKPLTQTAYDALAKIRELGGAQSLVDEILKNPSLDSHRDLSMDVRHEMLEIAADIMRSMTDRIESGETYIDDAETQGRMFAADKQIIEDVVRLRREHGRAGNIAQARAIFITRRTATNDYFKLYTARLKRYFGENAPEVQAYLADTVNQAAKDAVNGVVTRGEFLTYVKKILSDIQDPAWRKAFRQSFIYKNDVGFKSVIFRAIAKASGKSFENFDNEPALAEVMRRLISGLNIVPKASGKETEATAISAAINQVVKESAAAQGLVNEKKPSQHSDLNKLSAILKDKTLYEKFVNVLEQRLVNKWGDKNPSPEFSDKLSNFMEDLRKREWSNKLFDKIIVDKARALSIKVDRAVKQAERAPKEKLTDIGALPEQEARQRVNAIREALLTELKGEGLSVDAVNKLAEELDSRLEDKVNQAREKWAGSPGAIRKTLREVQLTVAKVAQMGYVKRDDIISRMTNRFIKDLGLSDTAKFPHATTLHEIFTNALSQAIETKRESILNGFRKQAERMGQPRMADEINKGGNSILDRIIKLATVGGIEDHTVYNAFAEKLKLPTWNETTAKKIADWGEKISNMPDGRDKDKEGLLLQNYLAGQKGLDWKDMSIAYMYVSLLSGPGTHAVNAFSNAGNLIGELAVQIALHPTRTMDYIRATFNGLMRGGRIEFKDVLASGLGVGKLGNKTEGGTILEAQDPVYLDKTAGMLGKLLSLTRAKYIGRFLQASDMFFYKGAQELGYIVRGGSMGSGDMWAGAINQAENEIAAYGTDTTTRQGRLQVEERALSIFEDQRMTSEADKTAWKDAHEYALEATFNNKPKGMLGSLADHIGKWSSDYKAAKLIVPFTKVVANVINTQLEYSPWGVARWYWSDTNSFNKIAGQRNDEILARAVLGTLATASLLGLVTKYWDDEDPWFTIYGDGPRDANKKRQLYDRGWKPNTLKIGHSYITYQNTPIALSLAALGTTLDRFRENSKLKPLDIIPQAAAAFCKSALNQSFASGIANLIEAVESSSPEKQMQQFIARTSTIGLPNLFKQLDAWIDPSVQDSQSFVDMFLKQVPVVREISGLKPMLNVFGEPVTRTQGPLNIPFSNRFWTIEKTDDSVYAFLGRNQLHVPGYSRSSKLGDKQMTEEQYYDYVKTSGPLIKKALRDEIPSLTGTKEEIQQRIDDIARYIKEDVRDQMRSKISR